MALSDLCQCELCFNSAADTGFLCHACLAALLSAPQACPYCAEPQLRAGLCHRCNLRRPILDHAYCSYLYSPPISTWLKHFKDRQDFSQLPKLLWLMQARHPDLTNIDICVYIPSERRKLLKRGYNPAELLARALAKTARLPIASHALIKHHSQDQRGLGRQQRLENSTNSLVSGKQALTDCNVLIIEDVFTTGATANAAARVLKQQGAKTVSVWALARSAPRFIAAMQSRQFD